MAKTGSERTKAWRDGLLAQGYKQKLFLLSPAALKALAAKAKASGESERDVIEGLLTASKRSR